MAETFEIKDGVNIGLTTAERDALTPQEGDTIYNTTDDEIQTYDGTQWNSVGGGSQDLQSVLDAGSTASVATEIEIVDTSNVGETSTVNLGTNLGINGAGITTVDASFRVLALLTDVDSDNVTIAYQDTPNNNLNAILIENGGIEINAIHPTNNNSIRLLADTTGLGQNACDIRLDDRKIIIRYFSTTNDNIDLEFSENGLKIGSFSSISNYISNSIDETLMPRGYITQNGTTGNRPSSPVTGERYFNTDNGVPEYYNGSSWVTGMGTQTVKKRIEIGAWDMDTNNTRSFAHGLSATEAITVSSISATIIIDSQANLYSWDNIAMSGTGTNGITVRNTGNIEMTRATGGIFDSPSFSSTANNRGFITLEYIPD